MKNCEYCGNNTETFKIKEIQVFESESPTYVELCIKCIKEYELA